MTRIVYATGNPGKLIEVSAHLATHGLKVESLRDFGVEMADPEETGTTLGDNARIKAIAYGNALEEYAVTHGERFVVLSDDTGLEIDGLGGEPGIHVRRWKDGKTRMGDQEIIDHMLWRMRGLAGANRSAQFKTIVAGVQVGADGRTTLPEYFVGRLGGAILEQPALEFHEGFPVAGLFYVDDWKKILGEVYALPPEEKARYLSHRERALNTAVPWIRKWV